MMCAPARAGKDTLLPILMNQMEEEYGGEWERFAFADKLKQDCEEEVLKRYGVSVWDDSQKHLYRPFLIEYGENKRAETDGKYLIDGFIDLYESNPKNYIISDFRFWNEFHEIFKYGYLNLLYETFPLYIERFISYNGLEFPLLPTIPQEVENYKYIKNHSYVNRIQYYIGDDWLNKLQQEKFKIN